MPHLENFTAGLPGGHSHLLRQEGDVLVGHFDVDAGRLWKPTHWVHWFVLFLPLSIIVSPQYILLRYGGGE